MEGSCLVSVITPAYNCARTIGETIESVINQTVTDWEMLIVDDCSTDNTTDVVEEYASKDNRIRLIRMENNSGSAAARNTAIACAKGRYIALLDSDDMWKPEKLERQLKFMTDNNYSFTFTAYDVFKDSSDKNRRIFETPEKITYRKYLGNSIIGCLTVMVDNEQIPDFHMENGYLEDTLTWMYYLRKGITAYGLNENLASYRIVEGSKSSKKLKNAGRFYKCLKQQEGIGLIARLYYQLGYMYHAAKKRLISKRTQD